MKHPTIAELAQAAGVSLSTVNRLMHGTSSVRPETARHILSTAEKIGFYGLGALRERKRTNLPHRQLGFLMQQSHRPLYQMWAQTLVQASSQHPDANIEPIVRFEDDLSPDAVASNLLDLGEQSDAVAVITADHPVVSQAIDELRAKGTPVVAYITDLSAASRAGFVGTDNWKAGRTAAWFISQMTSAGVVYPFIGSHRYQCQDISDASFRSYMREHAPDFYVSETRLTHEIPDNAYEMVRSLLTDEPNIKGIFVNGGGISGVLRAIREIPPERRGSIRVVCRDIGPETRRGLGEGLITAALCHPAEKMAQELLEVMVRLTNGTDTTSIEQRIVPFETVTPESMWA